ncbi:hypothetical protein QE152_g4974 [Popillia japonica]|uniref:Uncharacterized protein n=1 Tax=Popillia japonica TaxID=7064 RepID=A0AAW1MYW0_POPJA
MNCGNQLPSSLGPSGFPVPVPLVRFYMNNELSNLMSANLDNKWYGGEDNQDIGVEVIPSYSEWAGYGNV